MLIGHWFLASPVHNKEGTEKCTTGGAVYIHTAEGDRETHNRGGGETHKKMTHKQTHNQTHKKDEKTGKAFFDKSLKFLIKNL